MSWHFVERWLQKVNQHSTLIGKFWLTFLIIFRIVVVSSVGDRVYSDEQSEFKCNTLQVPWKSHFQAHLLVYSIDWLYKCLFQHVLANLAHSLLEFSNYSCVYPFYCVHGLQVSTVQIDFGFELTFKVHTKSRETKVAKVVRRRNKRRNHHR